MKPRAADAAASVLLRPFESGELDWPGTPVAVLRARERIALGSIRGELHCEQSFRPWADALQRAGFAVSAQIEGRFERVLLLPPRQREESRALLARAVAMTAPGGIVVAAAGKEEGARSAEADLVALAGPLRSDSKSHCRVFWTASLSGAADPALLEEWLALDATRPILDGRFISRPGLFAWDRIDPGSALLAECLPADASGAAADLGCAWGYLGVALLGRCPGIVSYDGFEAEARALPAARQNLTPFERRVRIGLHWQDVAAGIPGRYDLIVSNPPFHQGREAEPALGIAFIAAASEALRPGGRLLLVANVQLPYEDALRMRFATVSTLRSEGGFKVLEAIR